MFKTIGLSSHHVLPYALYLHYNLSGSISHDAQRALTLISDEVNKGGAAPHGGMSSLSFSFFTGWFCSKCIHWGKAGFHRIRMF